jgi:hypothetical protein
MLTRRAALGAPLLLVAPQPGAGAADWWGRMLPSRPTQFVFGYGSLVNPTSRAATAAAPVPAIPVRVSAAFGHLRAWNDRSPSGFTALGVRRPRPGEAPCTINGVLYPADGADMALFDAREAGYARVELRREDIEAVSWQRLPEEGRIWVYVPARPGGGAPGEDLPAPDAAFPLLQSYIDVVVEGALGYGPDYARELIETTADWSAFWLNDRELARRPWVHDGRYAVVDRLLAAAPVAALLPERRFPEEFAVRWLAPAR